MGLLSPFAIHGVGVATTSAVKTSLYLCRACISSERQFRTQRENAFQKCGFEFQLPCHQGL